MDDEKLLMDAICQNSGFFQLEPGPNKKAISLPLRDEDYTEDIKDVQAYLDKVKKIVRPGCSKEVLNVAVSSMSQQCLLNQNPVPHFEQVCHVCCDEGKHARIT